MQTNHAHNAYLSDLKDMANMALANCPRFMTQAASLFHISNYAEDIGQAWQDSAYSMDAPERMPTGATINNGYGNPVPAFTSRESE
jgi:hypothetical protein